MGTFIKVCYKNTFTEKNNNSLWTYCFMIKLIKYRWFTIRYKHNFKNDNTFIGQTTLNLPGIVNRIKRVNNLKKMFIKIDYMMNI